MLIFFVLLFITFGKSVPIHRRLSIDSENLSNSESGCNDIKENQNCICFDKVQLPVTDIMNNKDSLKRLVVYLYKDAESNTLQLYTPNKQKQAQFPDLGFEDGDLFSIGSETVHQIFSTNHNAVDIGKVRNDVDSDLGVSSPEDANLAYDVVTTPKYTDTENIFNKYKSVYGGIATDSSISGSFYNQNHNVNTSQNLKENHNLIGAIEDSSKGRFEYSNQGPGGVNQIVNYDRSLDFTNQEGYEGFPVVKLPLIDLPSNSNPQPFNIPQPQAVPTLAEINGRQSFAEQSKHSISNDAFNQVNQQSDNTVPKNPFLDPALNPEAVSGSKSQLEMSSVNNFPELDGKDFSTNDNNHDQTSLEDNPPEPLDNVGNEYVTFDIWFAQQMKKIQKMGKSPNKNVDLISLKHHIEKTLFENGLYVTKDGVLTDSKANALNVANLKLRPFLIGDSVTYDNLFAENQGDKYELPSNLPYLESVLVTLVHPPKILGVIPLGKTFVPRVSYRTGLDYLAWKAQNNMDDCTSWQCQNERVRQYQYYQSIGSKKHRPAKIKHMNSGIRGTKTFKEVRGRDRVKMNSHNKILDYMKKKVTPINKYQYRSDLDKVLAAVQLALLNKPSNHKNRKSYGQSKVHIKPDLHNLEELFNVEPSEENEEEDEDLPGFRIIGGLPATSSGTPVSSKGRSSRYNF